MVFIRTVRIRTIGLSHIFCWKSTVLIRRRNGLLLVIFRGESCLEILLAQAFTIPHFLYETPLQIKLEKHQLLVGQIVFLYCL